MYRSTRKLIAFIIAVVFLLSAFGVLAWATSGFTNWNAAKWFNSWGKGSSSAVVVVEETSARVRTSSTDVDHEIITDSEDGVTTFATTKLPTPSLIMDYNNDRIVVQFNDNLIGTVKLYYVKNGPTYNVISFTESDFVNVNNRYCAYYPLSSWRNYWTGALDGTYNSHVALRAQNVNKSGYIDSESTVLNFLNITEITSEFTDTRYKVKCEEDFYNDGSYKFMVCNTNSVAYQGDFVLNGGMVDLKNSSCVTYADGFLIVDLLSLSNLLTQPLDRYYFGFCYTIHGKMNDDHSWAWAGNYFSRKSWMFSSFSLTRLPAPTNLTYNAGTLTWDSVPGATKYGVFWTENGSEKKAFVDNTSYTFDVNALGVGEHTVRVRALGNLGQTAVDSGAVATVSAFNAGNVVTQVVALTYNVDGDVVTKFVPYGKNLSDYLYDVNIENKEFGGWFYDSGFSVKVGDTDVLDGDKTVYARISDKAVEEAPQTSSWWDIHKWQVLIPCFVFVGLLAIGIAALVIKKKKNA